jgi:hypothetical protein
MKTKLKWRQAGAGMVADEVPDYEGEIKRLRAVLKDADETLTEMGWHTDRGLLQRIRAALKS